MLALLDKSVRKYRLKLDSRQPRQFADHAAAKQ
jgi:hypothetical protein